MCGDSNDAVQAANAQEAARRRRVERGTRRVNNLFEQRANSGLYDRYEGDTLDLLQDRVNESKTDAARNLRFALARSGTVGGSNQVDQRANLREATSLATLNAIKRARGARGKLATADQQDKQNLLALVQSGMSAGQAARESAAAMKLNTSLAQEFALPQTFDQFFANIADYVNKQNEVDAQALFDYEGQENNIFSGYRRA